MSVNQPPPPPPGGYGGPPPPHDPYGAPPPAGPPAGAWDLGQTVSWAWAKFQANMGQIIIAALALFAAIAVIAVVGVLVIGAIVSFDTPFIVQIFLNGALGGVIFVVAQLIGAAIIRGALGITEGRPFHAADAFKFENAGAVLVTAVLVGVATGVGFILCYLPGIVIAFVTSYAMYFVIDKNLEPVDAIKASFELVKNNLGNTLIWYIVGGLIGGAGAIVCGIGLIFTLPIALLGTAYTYKVLTGQQVAA